MFSVHPDKNEEPFEKNENILLHLMKCIVKENSILLEKGYREKRKHKVFRLKCESLSAKIIEERKKNYSLKYYEKEEAKWQKILENDL